MQPGTLCALFGLIAVATAAVSPAPVDPLAGYLAAGGAPSGSQTLFAPWHVWAEDAGTILQNVTAASQEECAALCWQEPECALFDFRSCADETPGGSCAGAPSLTCRMFGMACGSVIPLGTAIEPGSFPMRDDLQDGGPFEVHPGRGLLGGDIVCNETLVPGRCVLASIGRATLICGTRPDCGAVVYFADGLDCCSSPLFVLLTSQLSSGGFLAPTVSTLTQLDQTVRFNRMVHPWEGNFTLPIAAELAAATSEAGQNGSESARPWLGCFSGNGLLMAGNVVGVVDGVPNPDACCRACRKDATCNVWTFCQEPAGCNYSADGRSFQLAGGQCQLRFNEIATPARGFPPSALAKGSGVPFIGGAPLATAAPQPPIPGFAALPGVTQYTARLPCPGSLRADIEECVLAGTAQELTDTCQSTPECRALIFMPDGGMELAGGQPIGMLKSNVSESRQALSLHSMLLVRQEQAGAQPSSAGSGGLSAGAIAGIAVGACAAVAVAAAAGWLLVQRRRRQARPVAENGKPGSATALVVAVEPALPLQDSTCSMPQTTSGSTPAAASSRNVPAASAAAGVPAEGLVPAPNSAPFSAVPKHLSMPARARASPFAAMSAARARVAAPMPLPPQPSSPSTGSTEGASSGHILPELKEHLAHCDAALSYGRHVAPRGHQNQGLIPQPSLLQSGELPETLKEWVVDIRDIEFTKTSTGGLVELGSGATATVYKAKLRGETVAAKEMDLGRSPDVQQQFVREAERLHQLRHPHVVALYGVALSGPKGILLMEYCAGRDLASCLQVKAAGSSRRLFGWYDRGRKIAVDVAAAVNFLHSRGVVHFDIKSSNVLLTGRGAPKLADVGVARLQAGTHLSHTPVVGTFAWMAPEIITGGQCSEKVDLFSLGVLLWEICTGERPRRGEMRSPHVPEECPPEVADLISQCMALEPRERPTAQQLLAQLEELAAQRDSCRRLAS